MLSIYGITKPYPRVLVKNYLYPEVLEKPAPRERGRLYLCYNKYVSNQ